jgi:hypothetical protein
VSTLVAGVRSAAGHPSRAADRRRHRHRYRHQPGHVCRTPAVRRAVVPEAAHGQSADGSGSLQLRLPVQGRPCGRPTPGDFLGRQARHGRIFAIQPLRYSLGHGITIAACTPMARVHPAQQQRGRGDSLLRDTLPGQLCLPNLWRLGGDLGAGAPRRLACEDRRVTLCRASFRRLANKATGRRGLA